jgi:Thioesterase domain
MGWRGVVPMSGARGGFTIALGLRRVFAGLAIASLALAATAPAASSAARFAQHTPGTTDASHPHVYLMRGLLNIFSLGMDQLATEIQSHGIDASVYNHTVADSVVAQIVAKYRAGDHGPYILVGHSLGADAVMTMAQSLNAQGVPVALVIPFDGTGSYAASKNVACVLNLTQRDYAYMRPGLGFRGKLQNVDVSGDPSIDHFTIDKSPRLQGMALNSILQTVRGAACRTPSASPIVASPKGLPVPKVASPNELPKIMPNEAPKQSVEAPAKSNSSAPHGVEG